MQRAADCIEKKLDFDLGNSYFPSVNFKEL